MGWQDLRFTLPPDWSLTAFSLDRADGYLKVDSPGTMFVQVKWTEPGARQRPKNAAGVLVEVMRKVRRQPAPDPGEPDLKDMLDAFLKQTEKQARKSKQKFDSRVKSEDHEATGTRSSAATSRGPAAGAAQGKIWYCRACGRVVIAQVVGQSRDNIASVAAQLFSEITDHPNEGWSVWALFDLVCARFRRRFGSKRTS